MPLPHVPLFLSTRDVPVLLAQSPSPVQESVVADLDLLQGGLLQPILRVRDDALARLLMDEARDDHRALRRDQRRRLVRWLGESGLRRLLHAAPARARSVALSTGARARLGPRGTHALLRYASVRWDRTRGDDTAGRDASDLDLALLGLACVAHRLHPPTAPVRLERLASLAHSALDRLRAPEEQLGRVRPSATGVADSSLRTWPSRADGLRPHLPPSWLAPLPLIDADAG